MNPEIKAKWLEALRSGKYRQCRGILKADTGAYCCLGVLREIVEPGSASSYADHNKLLTEEFLSSVGLTIGDESRFSEMNDKGATFLEIADIIEKEV